MKNKKKIIIISGPTASGKTDYSIELARKYDGIILNADSIQIYKGLPILSSQPNDDDKKNIEHFFFSYLEPYQNCNVGMWLKLIEEKINFCFNNNKTPIIVGGTGMYISKLINGISQIPEIDQNTRKKTIKLYKEKGYDEFYKLALKIDPELTKKINKNDKQRLMRIIEVYNTTGKTITYFQNLGNKKIFDDNLFFHININPKRDILYKRCELRFKKMYEQYNCLDEIKNFIKTYPNIILNINEYSISKTIGLIDGIKFLKNEITLNDFLNNSIKLTKNYAKRQYTWFNNQFKKIDLIINEIPKKDFEYF